MRVKDGGGSGGSSQPASGAGGPGVGGGASTLLAGPTALVDGAPPPHSAPPPTGRSGSSRQGGDARQGGWREGAGGGAGGGSGGSGWGGSSGDARSGGGGGSRNWREVPSQGGGSGREWRADEREHMHPSSGGGSSGPPGRMVGGSNWRGGGGGSFDRRDGPRPAPPGWGGQRGGGGDGDGDGDGGGPHNGHRGGSQSRWGGRRDSRGDSAHVRDRWDSAAGMGRSPPGMGGRAPPGMMGRSPPGMMGRSPPGMGGMGGPRGSFKGGKHPKEEGWERVGGGVKKPAGRGTGGISGPMPGSSGSAPSGSWRGGGSGGPGSGSSMPGRPRQMGFAAGRGRGGVLGQPLNPPAPGERPPSFFERHAVAGPALRGDLGASAGFLPGVKRYSRQEMLAVYRSIKKDGRLTVALAEEIPGLTAREARAPLAEMMADATEDAALEAALKGEPVGRSRRRASGGDDGQPLRSKLTDLTPAPEGRSLQPAAAEATSGGNEPPSDWLAQKFGSMGMGMLGESAVPSGNASALEGSLEMDERPAATAQQRFEDAQPQPVSLSMDQPAGSALMGSRGAGLDALLPPEPQQPEPQQQQQQQPFSFVQSAPMSTMSMPAMQAEPPAAAPAPPGPMQEVWLYRDPAGQVQGPFSAVDIVEWTTAGFFGMDLLMQHVSAPPDAQFLPLGAVFEEILATTRAAQGPPPPQQQPEQLEQQQQLDVGATGGMFGGGSGALGQDQGGAFGGMLSSQPTQQQEPLLPQQLSSDPLASSGGRFGQPYGAPGSESRNSFEGMPQQPPAASPPDMGGLGLLQSLSGQQNVSGGAAPAMPPMPTDGMRSLAELEAQQMGYAAPGGPGSPPPAQQGNIMNMFSQQQQQQPQHLNNGHSAPGVPAMPTMPQGVHSLAELEAQQMAGHGMGLGGGTPHMPANVAAMFHDQPPPPQQQHMPVGSPPPPLQQQEPWMQRQQQQQQPPIEPAPQAPMPTSDSAGGDFVDPSLSKRERKKRAKEAAAAAQAAQAAPRRAEPAEPMPPPPNPSAASAPMGMQAGPLSDFMGAGGDPDGTSAPQLAAQRSWGVSQAPGSGSSGDGRSLREIQEEQERAAAAAEAAARATAAAQAAQMPSGVSGPGGAWGAGGGGGNTPPPIARPAAKSLKEIQEEEARHAAELVARRPPAPRTAAQAVSGPHGNVSAPAAPWGRVAPQAPPDSEALFDYSGMEAQPAQQQRAPAPQQHAPALAPQPRSGTTGGWATIAASGRAQHQQAQPQPQPQSMAAAPRGGVPPPSSRVMGVAGGAAPPAAQSSRNKGKLSFNDWCKEQMLALNGSDDITLLEFCATLASPAEVNDYISTYLGSSAAVSSFTREFLNRRPQPGAAGDSGGGKKKNKKKGVKADAMLLGFGSGLDPRAFEQAE